MADGAEYRVPAAVQFKGNVYHRNFLPVYIPLSQTEWRGKEAPSKGETIYVAIYKDSRGYLVADHASEDEPSGDFLKARCTGFAGSTVNFDFPAGRLYMSPEEIKRLSVPELSGEVRVENAEGKTEERMKNEISALLHVKDGRAAVAKLLVNGKPAEEVFTTVGRDVRVKYATSGAEDDVVSEQKNYTEKDVERNLKGNPAEKEKKP